MLSRRLNSSDFCNNGVYSAALSYWLQYERSDLPLAITEMSFASYNTPVAKDGTLPFKIFGRKLNFKRIKEKGIPWLIFCGKAKEKNQGHQDGIGAWAIH